MIQTFTESLVEHDNLIYLSTHLTNIRGIIQQVPKLETCHSVLGDHVHDVCDFPLIFHIVHNYLS